MLNILNGVKLAQDDSTGDLYAVDCADGPKKLTGGGNVPTTGGVTTLHINVTAINRETMEATFTADKTPLEMQEASVTGSIWCVVTFAAGIMGESARSVGVPPAWRGGITAFGSTTANAHNDNGNNKTGYVVLQRGSDNWIFDVTQFGG